MAKTVRTTTNQIKEDGKNMEHCVEIKINENLNLKVNVYPTLIEKLSFVQTVVEGAFLDSGLYQTHVDARFDILFLSAFTDFNFPENVKNEDGDIYFEKAYNQIRTMFRFGLRNRLKGHEQIQLLIEQLENDVKQVIEFEKQKILALYNRNDTLDNLNVLIGKGMDFLNVAVEKLNSLTTESMGDIIKNIPQQFLTSIGDNADSKNK